MKDISKIIPHLQGTIDALSEVIRVAQETLDCVKEYTEADACYAIEEKSFKQLSNDIGVNAISETCNILARYLTFKEAKSYLKHVAAMILTGKHPALKSAVLCDNDCLLVTSTDPGLGRGMTMATPDEKCFHFQITKITAE